MWAKIWEVNGKQLYVRRKIFIPPNKKHYIILHHILLALACSTFQVQGTEISFAVLFKTTHFELKYFHRKLINQGIAISIRKTINTPMIENLQIILIFMVFHIVVQPS
jgi:hypothetical protein